MEAWLSGLGNWNEATRSCDRFNLVSFPDPCAICQEGETDKGSAPKVTPVNVQFTKHTL